jgi:cytochrome c peroxidase
MPSKSRLIIGLSALAVASALPAVAQQEARAARPIAAGELRLIPGDLLGKRLFEDVGLSEPAGLACASCHDPKTAYRGDNHSPLPGIARGATGALGYRKAPSVYYSLYSPPFSFSPRPNDVTGIMEIVPVGGQFWDGRAVDLAAQVEGPLLDKREMNNPSKKTVVDKVRAGPYAGLARDVFGADFFDDTDKAFDLLAAAIASYEGTARFKPFSSKFDAYLEGRTLLSLREARGFDLFRDKTKGNCLSCHDGGTRGGEDGEGPPRNPTAELSRNPKDWLFTDFTYDALGAPRNARIPDNADASHYDLGLCARHDLASFAPKDYDLKKLCGAFKTPTLRNVAVTGPSMHNGVFTTLRDAVAFYFTRDTNPERWYPKNADGSVAKFNDLPARLRDNVNTIQAPYDRKPGEAPRATDEEIDAIVAFLKTLTDEAPAPVDKVAGVARRK